MRVQCFAPYPSAQNASRLNKVARSLCEINRKKDAPAQDRDRIIVRPAMLATNSTEAGLEKPAAGSWAGSLGGGHQPGNDAGQPDVCVVTIEASPRVGDRCLIVGCEEVDEVLQVTFGINNVSPVLLHGAIQCP